MFSIEGQGKKKEVLKFFFFNIITSGVGAIVVSQTLPVALELMQEFIDSGESEKLVEEHASAVQPLHMNVELMDNEGIPASHIMLAEIYVMDIKQDRRGFLLCEFTIGEDEEDLLRCPV